MKDLVGNELTVRLSDLGMKDTPAVGGKNASLGEMIGHLATEGVRVPDGFAVTTDAYWTFLHDAQLVDRIEQSCASIAPDLSNVESVATEVQDMILAASLPARVAKQIARAYREACEAAGVPEMSVAVRSSATAEDLPDASFAGQQSTFLHVRGEAVLLDRVKRCFASLFTARAIAYRQERGFSQTGIALSVGVQQMVNAETGAAGVAFSIDTETGNPNVIVITGAWGLGEAVVQGAVQPDEYQVFAPLLERDATSIINRKLGAKHIKMVPGGRNRDGDLEAVDVAPEEAARWCLEDTQIIQLGRWVSRIARHYDCPMDIEWALDGETGKLFIVQARPETVRSIEDSGALRRFSIADAGAILTEGVAIGGAAAAGRARKLSCVQEAGGFEDGDVLVTETTDPDWLPVMRRASAIVTERGGRTSHAAIVSRELGLPAVTGAHGAREAIPDDEMITVACCDGAVGRVHAGEARIDEEVVDLSTLPGTRTDVMLNLGDPERAQQWWRLNADGVGLARMEFIIANHVGVHPKALLDPSVLEDPEAFKMVQRAIAGYESGRACFIDRLSQGLATIAATVWPKPVLVRTSDFKTNEYADLPGGPQFEPSEENPMLGWRGVSRYLHPDYKDAFEMECAALARARDVLGFSNINIMLPFCRTVAEGRDVLRVLADNGLARGRDGLEIFVMCEVPSNILEIDAFCELFDGFSIGSNDLTQLVLGVERDSERLSHLFDEQDPAVRRAIRTVIERAHANGRKVGLCGQGPSDNAEFAAFLVDCGIDSISVTPDSFPTVKQRVAAVEEDGLPDATHFAAE